MVQEEIRKADVTGVNRPVSWDGATKVRPVTVSQPHRHAAVPPASGGSRQALCSVHVSALSMSAPLDLHVAAVHTAGRAGSAEPDPCDQRAEAGRRGARAVHGGAAAAAHAARPPAGPERRSRRWCPATSHAGAAAAAGCACACSSGESVFGHGTTDVVLTACCRGSPFGWLSPIRIATTD